MWTPNTINQTIHSLALLATAAASVIAAWQSYRARGHAKEGTQILKKAMQVREKETK